MLTKEFRITCETRGYRAWWEGPKLQTAVLLGGHNCVAGLPYLANKYDIHPPHSQYLEHTCTKKLFIVYLKCKQNWASCVIWEPCPTGMCKECVEPHNTPAIYRTCYTMSSCHLQARDKQQHLSPSANGEASEMCRELSREVGLGSEPRSEALLTLLSFHQSISSTLDSQNPVSSHSFICSHCPEQGLLDSEMALRCL